MTAGLTTESHETAEAGVNRRRLVLTGAAFAVALGVLAAILTQTFVFGSMHGSWHYNYNGSWLKAPGELLARFSWPVWLTLIVATGVLAWGAPRWVERRERWTVLLALVAGGALQFAIRSLNKYSLAKLLLSDLTNSFFGASMDHPARAFLTNFEAIAPTLPQHARSNMPGKTLLFHFMELFTTTFTQMGIVLVALSTLAGLFVYLITRQLTGDRRTAIFALALFCVIPARVAFTPILNTVTPLLILLPLWLLLQELETNRLGWAVALGVSLYALVFFEPLPLVLGIVFALLTFRAKGRQPRPVWSIARLVLVTALAFLAVHAVMWLSFRYNLFRNFHLLLEDARDFNTRANRPYQVWVGRNLVEFFVSGGIIASALAGAFLLNALRPRSTPRPSWGQRLQDEPVLFLALAFALNLLVVDLLGVNRGEVSRLWIFLTPFLSIIAAQLCREWRGAGVFRGAFGLLLLQCVLLVTTVGFMRP